MAGRTKRGRRWVEEHEKDPWVLRARKEGWRSRAVYKLEELDRKEGLFAPGMTVVDLGAAPGAWSQYAARRAGNGGRVIGLDLLPMDPLPGVTGLVADFTEDEGLAGLEGALEGASVDLVLSDMAPNISGMAAVDQPRAMYLVELALAFARGHLKPGGDFVAKVFQGAGFDEFVRDLRGSFTAVRSRKPAASRDRSREVYVVARNYRV
jgi:23S rRNA (uridine2552-2'-O)-methyltransferase